MDKLSPGLANDPDVAWLNGIIGQVNKEGGMTHFRFKTIEKLIRVAGEAIELRGRLEEAEAEIKTLNEAIQTDCG